MTGKVLNLSLEQYNKMLKSLRKKEQDLGPNPLLKEWFQIRNQIRRIERKMKEIRNENSR